MKRIVAIHQPNFFPWLGYFDKILRSDIFIFLDDVQFPKTGGVWTNRVKLLIAGEARWATAAIDRNYCGYRTIHEMRFLFNNPWRTKILKSIDSNYRHHKFFSETMELIEPLLLNPESNVAEYNIHAVTCIAQALGLDVWKFKLSSDFPANISSNELLCTLTKRNGGSVYMCGGGAASYQDESIFLSKGIKIVHQNFKEKVYPQKSNESFVSGLSIVDAMMNVGLSGCRELLGLE